MGKPGPKPKPTALRMLEGNPSRRELNGLEPRTDDPPEKPLTVAMNAEASAEWDRILLAMPPTVYSALDTAALAAYALAWSDLVGAQKSIEANGLLLEELVFQPKTGELVVAGVSMNPAYRVKRASMDALAKWTDRLGLTPGVRSRLQMQPKDVTPGGKFAGLLGGGSGQEAQDDE